MSQGLEAKYVNITWHDKHTALKIVEAIQPIEVQSIDNNQFELDVINYSKIENGKQGILAFRLLDTKETARPYFLLEDGTKIELLPFKDNQTKKTWWIEGSSWDSKSRRWHSRIYRSVGAVSLHLLNSEYTIHISTSSFTSDQLEDYLVDFRNDLWELILDDSSYVKGAGKISQDDGVDEATLKAITQYLDNVALVLKKSKVELRESQELAPRKSVKPVPRTFMELVTKGDGKYLTSRATIESKDVPENRYVHYTLQRVYLILRVLASVSRAYGSKLEKSIAEYQKRLAALTSVKIINEEAVRYDLRRKREHFASFASQLKTSFENLQISKRASSQVNFRSWTLIFNVTKQAKQLGPNTYFANVKTTDEHDWFIPNKPDYVTVEFDQEIQISTGFEYLIAGHIKSEKNTYSNKTRFAYTVFIITEIKIIGGLAYEKLKKAIEVTENEILMLKANSWSRKLTRQELVQQEKEKVNIEKMLTILKQKQDNMCIVNKVITPKLPVAKKLLQQFQQHSIKTDSSFPNSMTFVQNPNYQGVYSQFKIIKAMAGIHDDDLLIALEKIDNIALVNVSNLYERWCLVQIIKVLIQKLGYKSQQDWKRLLIKQIFEKGKNVYIDLKNQSTDRSIRLWYEKELDNGYRPDFALDVEAICPDTQVILSKRFVIDAKFYQDINHKRHGGISAVIKNLYFDKDYSERSTNSVYILHPTKDAVPTRKTPQQWAKNSYYGEVPMFEWDEELRLSSNHDYGAVYLSPIGHDGYLDELQRLIGMFLQYGVEDDRRCVNSAVPNAKIFCISCGSDRISFSQGKNDKVWWITCDDCSHFTVYSYCWGCNNKLIKNGDHWTYHSTEPLHPLNVKCPSCESLVMG
jgi:hypothetical protein